MVIFKKHRKHGYFFFKTSQYVKHQLVTSVIVCAIIKS